MNEQDTIKALRDKLSGGEIKSPTLKRADDIIHGERQDQYGDPEDSFQLISAYWTVYLDQKLIHIDGLPSVLCLDGEDVAILMTLFKIARMSGQKWKSDNAVDACGYLAILNDRIKSEG